MLPLHARASSETSPSASALHLRPIIAVYHHVRRNRHPLSQQGKWMHTEDELLIGFVVGFREHIAVADSTPSPGP